MAGALALLAVVGQAAADDVVPAFDDRLSLRAGTFTPDQVGLLHLDQGAFDATTRYVIGLDGPMTPERAADLDRAGVRRLGYLPTNYWIASLGNTTPAQLRGLGYVRSVGFYREAWKVDEALRVHPGQRGFETGERVALAATGQLAVRVWLFDDSDSGELRKELASRGGRVIEEERVGASTSVAGVIPNAASVDALAALRSVQFIEELPEFTPRSNSTVRWVVQSALPPNPNPVTPLYANALTGAGQVMGIIDGWLAHEHCSFADTVNPIGPLHRKILAYNTAFGYNWHGTHVSGTAVGDAGDWTDTRGVAFDARLVFNIWPDVSEPSVYSRFDLHRQQGAFIHTNSWGNNLTTAYDGTCRAIDTIQWESDAQLLVFAVTNLSGVRNPENAKNLLAVTATGGWPNFNTMCGTTGAGPTIDGRRKPEIAAPGCLTMSSIGQTGCLVSGQSGTSMAAPAVAGAALLARQYFVNGLYPSGVATASDAFVPSGALVKAAVINSGADMTGVTGYPSDREGWGRVVADDALFFAGDARRLLVWDIRNATSRALTTGKSVTSRFSVEPAPALSLRVTLAYHDAPAMVGAALAPVNNLDLQVRSPSGVIYRGNVLASGSSVPGGTPDALNNVEQVILPSPEPGDWTVTIFASAVNEGAQGYALVITGNVLEGSTCIADYNNSGGTPDDADVYAFFMDWAAGEPGADVNQSGGVPDDADVAYFFERWNAGC